MPKTHFSARIFSRFGHARRGMRRAAAAAAGGGRVRRGKTAMDGMTLCIVEQEKWHFQWQAERNEM